MSAIRDRAISLLGQGYNNTVVASAVGVTPGYITQLLEEDEVREEVSRLRAARLEKNAATDTTISELEDKALNMVKEKMPFVKSPMEAVKIFQTLNNAKRKTAENNGVAGEAGGMGVVTITIPAALAAAGSVAIQLNNQNQVIEVDGRSMTPLPSRALATLGSSGGSAQIEDATPKPTRLDIQNAAKEAQAKRDLARAAKILENVTTPVHVNIDGVDCVL